MSTLRLVGVVETGGPWFEPGAPQTPNVAVAVTRGQSTTVHIAVVQRDGLNVDLTDAEVVFVVKKNTAQYEATFRATATNLAPGTDGRCVVEIPYDAFRLNEPGNYVYDVTLIRGIGGAQRDFIIPASPFLILPSTYETLY